MCVGRWEWEEEGRGEKVNTWESNSGRPRHPALDVELDEVRKCLKNGAKIPSSPPWCQPP